MATNDPAGNEPLQKLLKHASEVEQARLDALKLVVNELLKANPSHVIVAWLSEEGQQTSVQILDPPDGGVEILGLARIVDQAAMNYLFGKDNLKEVEEDDEE